MREELGPDFPVFSIDGLPDFPVFSIDGLEVKEFDYIDIGAILNTSGAVPW